MPEPGDELVQQRLAKLKRIREKGIDPYPRRYCRSHTAQEAVVLFEGLEKQGVHHTQETVQVAGRIISLRGMGKASFLDLCDGSGKIQVYLRKDRLGEERYALLKELDLGDFLGVSGTMFRTKTGEVTVEASDCQVLAKSVRPPPEKWHGLVDVEKRYRQRYLDLMSSEEVRSIFRVRSKTLSTLRRFLDSQGFMEVETPILLPLAAGAMARPFATQHHALDRELYLRIATELHLKRLIVGGFDKVCEIGRVFRNEGIDVQHNPEFTTLESYEAYADYNDVMTMVEQMFGYIAQEVVGTVKLLWGDQTVDLTPPWRRVPLREAIKDACGVDFQEYPDANSLGECMVSMGVSIERNASRGRLIDKLLSTYVEPTLLQPTFLLDYPLDMSPLAKRKPDDSTLVERFEAYIGGMEVANAFTELNDPIDQRERFIEQERLRKELGDEEFDRLDEDFLVAIEHGMPPTGGLGVGIDRMVMLLTNQRSIREVILFPQMRTK